MEWREPKLMVIYVLDETGQVDRAIPWQIDGTYLSPDHVMELVAYHLHRRGAIETERERAHYSRGRGCEWEPTPMSVKQDGQVEVLSMREVKDDAA